MNTPEGEKECTGLEYRIEDVEPPVRLVLADGTVLLSRVTIGGVYTFEQNNGEIGYFVMHQHSVQKVG